MKNAILSISLIGFQLVLCSQNYRYTNTMYPSSFSIDNVTYTSAPAINGPFFTVESSTSNESLQMDIYTPINDTVSLRPAIIFAHPGGFLLGDRKVDDMNALCDTFARKGYVTATIDYRKGFNLVGNTELHSIRAAYRGLQDGRAAVRYLRANASLYGIDASKIYFVGSSAGSLIGLHTIYLDTISEIPSQAGEVDYINLTFPFSHTAPSLGPLDIGDHLSYNGKPDALVAMWGAVQSTDLITTNDTTPVLLIHGEDDQVVSFNSGSPFGYPLIPETNGSNLINARLDDLGITNKETYFVAGQGHEFHGTSNGNWSNGSGGNSYYPIMVDRITNFLWKQHRPMVDFNSIANALSVSFTDLSNGGLAWFWDFGDGTSSTDQNPTHTYASQGTYTVKLYVENNIQSWNELSKTISVDVPALSVDEKTHDHFLISPNPTQGRIRIQGDEYLKNTQCFLYSVSGKLLLNQILTNKEHEISLNHLENGLYFLILLSEHGSQTVKIIKQD